MTVAASDTHYRHPQKRHSPCPAVSCCVMRCHYMSCRRATRLGAADLTRHAAVELSQRLLNERGKPATAACSDAASSLASLAAATVVERRHPCCGPADVSRRRARHELIPKSRWQSESRATSERERIVAARTVHHSHSRLCRKERAKKCVVAVPPQTHQRRTSAPARPMTRSSAGSASFSM